MKKFLQVILFVSCFFYLYGSDSFPINIRDDIIITNEQIEKVKEVARTQYHAEIKKINIGELVVRSGDMGAWVYFEDEVLDTFAIERWIAIKFECELREKANPKTGAKEIERVVLDKPFVLGKLWSTVKRIFSLETATLYLEVPDKVSYDLVESLLKSIEKSTYRQSTEDYVIGFPMSAIVWLEYSKDDETITIHTDRNRFYKFKIKNYDFDLIDWGSYEILR